MLFKDLLTKLYLQMQSTTDITIKLEQVKMLDLTERSMQIKRDSMGNKYYETIDERIFHECSYQKIRLSQRFERIQKIIKERRTALEKEYEEKINEQSDSEFVMLDFFDQGIIPFFRKDRGSQYLRSSSTHSAERASNVNLQVTKIEKKKKKNPFIKFFKKLGE